MSPRLTPRAAWLAIAILALALGGLAAAGCGGTGKQGPPPGKARANPHYGAPGAKVVIVSPKAGASVGPDVTVDVRVTGFKLDAKALNKPPRQGQGHLHFRMDGGRYDRPRYSGANGRLAARLGVVGRFSPAVAPTITYRGLPRGRHTVVVSLANNDLSETGVEARTAFTVR